MTEPNFYPSKVCAECAESVGAIRKTWGETITIAECDVCDKTRFVIDPAVYGNPKFEKTMNDPESYLDGCSNTIEQDLERIVHNIHELGLMEVTHLVNFGQVKFDTRYTSRSVDDEFKELRDMIKLHIRNMEYDQASKAVDLLKKLTGESNGTI